MDIALTKKLTSGLFNIEGQETLSVKELVDKIYHHYGEDVPIGCFGKTERIDVGMKYLALDGSKLQKALGYKPKITIEDTIDDY